MRTFNVLYKITAAALLSLMFVGCLKEESNMARAVLASVSSLTFEGQDAEEQIITVYSDANWVMEAPDWISVSPNSGCGTTDVSITVTDNVREGALDNPRKAELVFKGNTIASEAKVIIRQDGDKYRGIKESTVSELVSAEEGAVLVVPEAAVVALTSKGYIISDGSSQVYVLDETNKPALGDKISFGAEKTTDKGLAAVSTIERFKVNSNAAVTYPQPNDITANVGSYTATSREYITATGLLKGSKLEFADAEGNVLETSVAAYDLPAESELKTLTGHNVAISGYFAGKDAEVIYVVVAAYEDLGLPAGSETIYFTDDFSWMQPYADYYKEKTGKEFGKSVEDNNPDGNAPNAYTEKNLVAAGLMTKFTELGYMDIYPSNKTMYPQNLYWKMGATDKNTGIALPAIDFGAGPVNIKIRFNWAAHRRVSKGVDETDLVKIIVELVDASGNSLYKSEELSSAQPLGKIEWQDAEVALNNVTSDMRIVIRPVMMPSDPVNHRNRWYIDNIEVVSADGANSGPQVVFNDDFSWLQPLIDAYNAAVPDNPIGDAVGTVTAGANAPNVYSTDGIKDVFPALFAQAGYVDLCPSEKTLYLQNGYLKFSRTGGHNTALQLASIPFTKIADATLEFDWCAQIQGDGTVDDTVLTVQIIGDGTFENGTKYSDDITNKQQKGEMFWTHSMVKIKGASPDTKLNIIMTRILDKATGECNFKVSGAGRWYVDNIKVTQE